jgi:glycerophosphoryl diester phosphodiesterase
MTNLQASRENHILLSMRFSKDIIRLTTVICLVLGCHLTKNQFVQQASFDVEGHRGCRGLIPENTIPAMYKAIDLGVNTLEMDAVITKDKQVVISHEPFFNHEITTKPDGTEVKESEERSLNIYQMTYDEVKQFDVGKKVHPRFPQQQKMAVHKPRLADLIDSVEQYYRSKKRRAPDYNIETKTTPATDGLYHPGVQEFVELLMAVIRSKGIQERVIIQSFDFRTLQYVHEHYPSMRTAMLIEDFDKRGLDQQLKALGFTPTIYSPDYSLVNEKLVSDCHALKMKVIPWTVDDKETIDKLGSLHVDGIITDYPDLFR